MSQLHRAGDKAFIDYSGKKPSIVDPKSGERVEVELFVAVLGASSYTYAEATRTQRVADFVSSHVRALEFFGGVPPAPRRRAAADSPDRCALVPVLDVEVLAAQAPDPLEEAA